MAAVRQRTLRLPGELHLTFFHLTASLNVATLRAMLGVCDWYVVAGDTYRVDETGTPVASTGFGFYFGTTAKLEAKVQRAGVSLHSLTTVGSWRLRPTNVILINKTGRPVGPDARLVVEARVVRALFRDGWTVLNCVTSAPTARQRATRQERHWADYAAEGLADVITGQIGHGQLRGGLGGSSHEQLVRLVLSQSPQRAMSIDDVLTAARQQGLRLPGAHPRARARRDLTSREHDTGRPRIMRIHVAGRLVVHPATMSASAARVSYYEQNPAARREHQRRLARRRARRLAQRTADR
jgi:hypothetical protein